MSDTGTPQSEPPSTSNHVKDEPEAQAVLTNLDDCVQDLSQEIPVPLVTADDIGPPILWGDILYDFKWPLTAGSVVGISALGVIHVAEPLLYKYFPYYATLVNFLGGAPSTFSSLQSMAEAIIPRLEAMEQRVVDASNQTRSRASQSYETYSTYVVEKKTELVRSIVGDKAVDGSGTVSGSTRSLLEKLQSFVVSNDTIEKDISTSEVIGKDDATTSNNTNKTLAIPATKTNSQPDLEEQNKDQTLTTSYTNDTSQSNILRGSRHVPLPLQSKELFTMLITFPILVLLLCFQLTTTWYFDLWLDILQPVDTSVEIRSKWKPLYLAIQTFVFMAGQITFAMMLSKASRVARIVNQKVQKRGQDVNQFRKKVVGCMVFLRQRFVDFLNYVNQTLRIGEYGSRMVGKITSVWEKGGGMLFKGYGKQGKIAANKESGGDGSGNGNGSEEP